MPSILGNVAGAVVGGLMGGDDEQSQSQSREPWKPIQPWLIQNAETGQALQNYYQQNPWNQPQMTAYQNMATDADNYRQNINPGLMEFANKLMGTNYSRVGQPAQTALAGQTQTMQPQQGQSRTTGPFSAPQGQAYGLLDFKQLNPFTAINGIPAKAPAAAPAAEVDPANKPYDWRDDLERILAGKGNSGGGY